MPHPARHNRKAGFVTFPVTDRVRIQEGITEGLARHQAADRLIDDVVRVLVEMRTNARRGEAELLAANERLTAAAYVEPIADASMVAA